MTTDLPAMPLPHVPELQAPLDAPHCPRCRQPVCAGRGGWGQRYTQVLLHLDHCAPDFTAHERLVVARELVPDPRSAGRRNLGR